MFLSQGPGILREGHQKPFPQNTKSPPRVSCSQGSPKVSDVDEEVKDRHWDMMEFYVILYLQEVGATEGKLEEGMC